MSKRTLIGLMFCTLFLSAPVFAQESTAQPVIQTAQAAQNDVTIPTGATQEFDAAKGEIKFDGVLTNKGTIIIRSSNPAQTEAILSAEKFVNEGRIVSEVPSLTINASILGGTGDYNAPEAINVRGTDRLEIRGGRFYSEWFRPKTKGWLIINANRIDGKVELEAEHLSMGVREGNLNVIKQKLDGDPLIYNTGGDITTPIAPSGGHDLLIIASGDVIVSGGIDATGSATQDEGNIAILTGAHFARPHDGEVILPCGISNGQGNDCNNLADSMSLPGMPLEPAQGDFPMSGKIVISGEVKAHVIIMTSREIEINGDLHAVEDGMLDGAAISLFATKSITVTGTIKADANTVEPSFSAVSLIAPTVNVSNKITSDAVTIEAFENSEASTGSVTTAAIEARRYLDINGGHIQFGEAGGAFTGGVLPLSQPHDSGEFTIKTGKLTAHQFINLAATGNIDAGNIELLTNELEVPLYTHDVRIHANVGKEDAPPLKIGGGTNGAASITVQGTTDLGEGLTQKTGAIFLTNGPSGDIVIDGAKLHVTNEHDGTPSLIAYAGTGQVTVKGNIILDGTSSAPAGQVLLVGDEIRSTGATISAKDTLSAAADNPAKVVLATSKLTLAGDLTIEANSKAQTSVKVVPKGSITLDPQDNFPGIYVYVDKFPINVTDDEVVVGGAGNLTFKANSDEGKILITAKTLTFANAGTTDLISNGEQTLIKLDHMGENSGQNSLIFTGGAVTLNTDSETSDAGEINLLADGIRSDGGADLSLLSRSQGTGNGGVIIISAQKINLDEATVNHVDVSALSSGDGGHITVQSLGRFDLGSIVFDANGIGSGAGGRVDLLNERELDFEVTQLEINARGGTTGFGGVAGIGNIPASDFLSFIHVEGGQSINVGDFDGAIGLNTCSGATSCAVAVAVKSAVSSALPDGVDNFCRRIRTGNNFWPDHYWNCVPVAQASSKDSVAASVASGPKFSQLRNTLNQTEILVWKNGGDFKHAWKDTTTSTLSGGLTFRLGQTIYVNPWQRGSIGSKTTAVNYSNDQYSEVSAHELGHAVDIALGGAASGSKPSDQPNWASHLTKDELEMNLVLDSTQNLIRRLPCDVTPLGNGTFTSTYPLNGVKDATSGVDVCVNGLVNDALLTGGATWDQNTVTASQVMRHIEAGLFVNNAEPHAQAFSWATVGTKGARPMMDKVFDNGFYRCLNRFAVAEQNGAAPADACPFFIETH